MNPSASGRPGRSGLPLVPESGSIGQPILVFGMPRSGTTWVGKIFDSHPQTLYRHEPDSVQRMDFLPLLPDRAEAPRFRSAVHNYVREITDLTTSKVVAKPPLFSKTYYSPLRLGVFRSQAAIVRVLSHVRIELPVGSARRSGGDAGIRLVWKSIESLARLPVLLAALPSAVAIHIIRHPCGYVASVLRGEAQRRFTHNAASEDYGIFAMLAETVQARRRGLDLAAFRALAPVERLAWRWLLFNERAMEGTVGVKDRVQRLRYEDLCLEPLQISRRLFEFAGLDWSEQAEMFIRRSTTHASNAYYSVFKNPRQSAFRWRQELSEKEIDQILAIASQGPAGLIEAADSPAV